MEESDAQLMERFLKGDEAAFAAIVRRYQQKLFNFFLRHLHDYALAEDQTQEVFIRVFRYGKSFDCRRKFKPWFYRIAQHQLKTSRRTRNREIPLADEVIYGLLPASESDYEVIATVKKAVNRLPGPQREIVMLKHYQGLTFAEIAETIGCPEGTVKTRFYFALQKLKTWLSKSRRMK